MSVPEGYYFTEEHEWIKVEGDVATVGVSEHAQHELGEVVFVELPELDEEYDQSEDFAVIESVKAVSDVYLPMGGKIVEVNEVLLDQPELINEEPYEGGWLAKIEISDESELDSLMDSVEYTAFLEEE